MADETDLAAAEYVLGTLEAGERRAFAKRIATEPEAARAVAAWTERLAPLALTAAEIPPPPALWPRIEAAIGPRAANDNRVARWRAAALAASFVALAMTGVAWRGAGETAPAAVAALSAAGGQPAALVAYDARGQKIDVTSVNLAAPAGKSLELWMIAGAAAPRSMGMMSARPSFRGVAIDPKTETMFAISIEPIGGSPTGAPTGPVVYSGKLVALPTGA